MLAKRIVPCLDIKDGKTVKGINFVNFRDAGDPVELGARRISVLGYHRLTRGAKDFHRVGKTSGGPYQHPFYRGWRYQRIEGRGSFA